MTREPQTRREGARDPVAALLGRRPRDVVAEQGALRRLHNRMLGTPPVAQRVSRYVLLEEIGRGGLGTVYSAYDPHLNRKVAVKLLRTDSRQHAGAGARLLREAQAMAQLAHPNVVAVHDVGRIDAQARLPGHEVFIAMELVDGMTLSQWWAQDEIAWQHVRDVLVGAAHGLAAAHDAGLVHRDFKPANVLVSNDARARVLDFGLARSCGPSPPTTGESGPPLDPQIPGDVTPAGAVVGTPAYMSPEQVQGLALSPLSDQFSFCVTLFEGLYGYRPFAASDTAGLFDAIVARCPRARPPGTSVPAWMHRVVMRGLDKDPEQRFASMRVLALALQRDRRSKRRQRVALVVAVLASATTASAVSYLARPQPSQGELDKVQQWTDAARAAAAAHNFVYPPLSDQDAQTAYQILHQLEQLSGAPAELGQARAGALRDEFADTLLQLADHYYAREGGRPFAADYYAAVLAFRPQDPKARARSSYTPGELADLRDRAGRGEFSEGELLAGETLAVLAEPGAAQRRRRAEALLQRQNTVAPSTATRLRALVRAPGAETPSSADAAPRAAPVPPAQPVAPALVASDADPMPPASLGEVRTPSRDPSAVTRAAALCAQADAAVAQGRDAQAEVLYHRALDQHRRHARSLGGLSLLHFERAEYHRAIRFGVRAVVAAPRTARYRIVLGDAYVKVLAYADARTQYTKARASGSKTAGRRLTLLREQLGQ